MKTLGSVMVMVLVLAAALPLAAGGRGESPAFSVVATTSQIGDAVGRIAPNLELRVLMGPGVDPHSYAATARDIEAVRRADVVFWNGLFLEAQLEGTMRSLGAKAVELGRRVPESRLLPWEEYDGHDPHIWYDLALWELAAGAIADVLADKDPANADSYRRNAATYAAELRETHEWALAQVATIPPQRRVLVSSHDAFGYLARAYGFENHGIEGISTADEAGVLDIIRLADLIVEREVPAIFTETTVSDQTVRAVVEAVRARGGSVRIAAEPLFSDAIGDKPPVDTLIGSFRHNIEVITRELERR